MTEIERRADMAEITKAISKVGTDVALLGQEVKANIALTQKVHDKLYGNGIPGIGTDLEVTKSSLRRAWWFISAIGVGLIAGILKVVFT